VIFALTLVALLVFVGLAIDAGLTYVAYGQLKRAVDSAAVASANNFKRGKSELEMKTAALEVLRLHNVDTTRLELNVQICDADRDGFRDDSLQTEAPRFFLQCPDTDPNVSAGSYAVSPRKLVYVEATQQVPFYFLSLIGINKIDLRTDSTAEAAPIDLVLVIDTSESMAAECQTRDPLSGLCQVFKSHGYTQSSIEDYDPNLSGNCNTDNSCHPLREAKDAAIQLVRTLYDGYDNIGIVTFNTSAVDRLGGLVNTINRVSIENQITNIHLHDDAPYSRLWPYWQTPGRFNPINLEDRDGDGLDRDDPVRMGYFCTPDEDRWDETQDPFGWGGVPCDDNNLLDSLNWVDENLDGDSDPTTNATYSSNDSTGIADFLTANDPDGAGPLTARLSVTSTCTGCAMRTAANILKSNGRPGAVWVIVFLSDGYANMSDTYVTSGGIVPAGYTNGFCSGQIINDPALVGFWPSFCIDREVSTNTRYCIDTNAAHCPPHSLHLNSPDPRFSSEDYARDMTDDSALTRVRPIDDDPANPLRIEYNINEPVGADIVIYSIGLGDVTPGQDFLATRPNWGTGEKLLRYMAAVGDDGDRVSDPCRQGELISGALLPAKQSCGNYYYAPQGSDLLPIFEDIAGRIYTRISQ
jgi:hypothetical protein